jgi:hypothetical protein
MDKATAEHHAFLGKELELTVTVVIDVVLCIQDIEGLGRTPPQFVEEGKFCNTP